MKLVQLRLQNFRCFVDRPISFGDYTCLIGPGGAGKSTILNALRIFFRDTTGSPTDLLNLHEEDFHGKDTKKDVVITATFSDLEPDAQEDFKHYFRQGQLVISAVARWNDQSRSAEVKQFGQRAGMRAFADFFKAEGDEAGAKELKSIYAGIRDSHPDLPAPGPMAAMAEALRAYESAHPELCELIPSEDKFYGISRGANRLQKYIQWVFVPAVKDASTEQVEAKKTALGQLLDRTVRSKMSFSELLAALQAEVESRYRSILDENQIALESLSKSLTARLQEWAHPAARLTLSWQNDPARSVSISEPLAEVLAGEGRFQGTLARFGHGLQRSFLLALLQELSGCVDTGNPRLMLACEEPELYQHPPQARHLSSVLQKLSRGNSQIIVSTHSPYFVSGQGFQDVRLVRQDLVEDQPCVKSVTFQDLSEELAKALGEKVRMPTGVQFKVEQSLQAGLNEMFFSPVLILVEGLEDVAYVSTQFVLADRMEEFRRLGCHIVPTSGKGSMIQPLAIAKMLDIPTYVIFDADGDDITRAERRAQHERDNVALLRLSGVSTPDPFPTGVFQTSSLTVWPTNIGAVVKEEIGRSQWEAFEATVRRDRKIQDIPDLNKNMLFIGSVLSQAFQEGKKSTILDGLCNQIVSFARSVRAVRPIAAAAKAEADPSS
jgi:putative ATP-dependent endonuclease of OLD family